MPANNHAKTESAPKRAIRFARLAILLVLTAIAAVVVSLFTVNKNPSSGVCIPASLSLSDNSCIFLEYAITPEQRQKGLGGRVSLPEDKGMLFVFNDAGSHCFWMQDMRFAIDMVWLDVDKKIVTKHSNVSPETYPAAFCPKSPARYVIEVNAGKADSWDIGDMVSF